MNDNTEEQQLEIKLPLSEVEKWNESWAAPGMLTIKLQRQLVVNRVLTIFLAISCLMSIAVIFAYSRRCG